MSGTSRKISELTTATALVGTEVLPIVQDGETRQVAIAEVSAFSPVRSVNGLTGVVELAISNIIGVEGIVQNGAVSALIGAVSARVDTVETSAAAVSVRVDSVSAAITSVQAYVLAQISVATSGVFTEAPNDGQVYGRQSLAWVPVSITALANQIEAVSALVSSAAAIQVSGSITDVVYVRKNSDWVPLTLAYDVGFDFGASTVPAGEYAKIVAPRTFYILPSCSGSRLAFNTSAFPAAIVSIPIMFPTSTTLGILTIGVSGTATWPAIATTSVSTGQTFGVQTSVSSDANLTGLVITFAGYYRP